MKEDLLKFNFGKIGVLMGGASSEREISLKSGRAVYEALNTGKYDVTIIDLTTEDRIEASSILKKSKISVAFIALHGRFGEDGTVQALLEELGIPYTGSGVMPSRLALDKVESRKAFQIEKIPVPHYEIFKSKENINFDSLKRKFKTSVLVVKPASQGSSIGVSFVESQTNLSKAVDLAFKYDDIIIIEEYLPGREVTVGILEDNPLPVIEIVPKKRFFDFQAKYENGLTDYVVPAELPSDIYKKVQEIGLRAHQALGCRAFSRVDIILKDATPFVLEVNTIPGLTATSLVPKAAKAINIDFLELCLRLIRDAYGTKKDKSNS